MRNQTISNTLIKQSATLQKEAKLMITNQLLKEKAHRNFTRILAQISQGNESKGTQVKSRNTLDPCVYPSSSLKKPTHAKNYSRYTLDSNVKYKNHDLEHATFLNNVISPSCNVDPSKKTFSFQEFLESQ